jgi:hypothetical protein
MEVFAVAASLATAILLPSVPAHAQWARDQITYSTSISGLTEADPNTSAEETLDGVGTASLTATAYSSPPLPSGGGSFGYSGTITQRYIWVGAGDAPATVTVGELVYTSGEADTASDINSSASGAVSGSTTPANQTGEIGRASGSASSASFGFEDDPIDRYHDEFFLIRTNDTSGNTLDLVVDFSSHYDVNVVLWGYAETTARHAGNYSFP